MTKFFPLIVLATWVFVGGSAIADTKPSDRKEAKWEFMVSSGILAPTGSQEDFIKLGKLTSAQLSYVVRQDLALNGSFGWARTRDKSVVGAPKVDLFTYDVGAEFRGRRVNVGSATNFRPFVGTGIGAMTYSYRNVQVDTSSFPAAYVSAGGEFGYRMLRVRLEARDYLSGFSPVNSSRSSQFANQVTVMLGLRFVSR